MSQVFGLPVTVLRKERYRYRPRTGECFRFEFGFYTGSVDFRTGRHIPDYPGQPKMQEVWSRVPIEVSDMERI